MSNEIDSFRALFGSRLATSRKHAGLSQTDLADRIGIGRATLSRYERGELSPTIEVVDEILRAFDNEISADWLLGRELEEPNLKHLIKMRSFGCMVAMRFTKGGIAEVLLSASEVRRILRVLMDIEADQSSPDKEVIEQLNLLLDRTYEKDHWADLAILADIVIAQLGVKFTPSIPEWEQHPDLVSHWSVFGGIDRDQNTQPEPKQIEGQDAARGRKRRHTTKKPIGSQE